MNERIITDSHIRSFEQQLMLEEKSACTVRKYLHDVRMFADFCAGAPVMQDVLIASRSCCAKNIPFAVLTPCLHHSAVCFRISAGTSCM